MGSRNQDGSAIAQARQSIRNIGAAQTIAEDRLEASIVLDKPVALSSNADLEKTQYSVTNNSSYLKTTDSSDDTLVARDAATQDKPATDIDTPQKAVRHTGNRLVVGDSIDDDVLSREQDTGSFD